MSFTPPCSRGSFLSALEWEAEEEEWRDLLSPGAQGKRCDSADCTSAQHQPRAQLAELCMQYNFAKNHVKKLEQTS